MIESSFLKQYGIRLRTNEDMSWSEFCSLLSGIMHDTPLGNIVAIRAEKDPKVIQKFSKDEKRIRSEWFKRKNKKLMDNPEARKRYWEGFQKWAKDSFL